MKRSNTMALIIIGLVSAVIAYIVSGVLFKANDRAEKVPTVESINQNFPDIRNDADYKVIFNDKALDATQPVQIQGNNNTNPFVNH